MATTAAFTVDLPVKIIFGAGRLSAIGEETAHLGKHACLVTSPELSELAVVDAVCLHLRDAGIGVTILPTVRGEPTNESVDHLASVARGARCDVVIGLGGGSCLDSAKGVAIAATHPGPIWDYMTYYGATPKPATSAALPVVAIPTTSGSGSEVSPHVVLVNPGQKMKAALTSRNALARTAIVDPALMCSAPPRVTATSGADALCHGIECYLNVARRSPMSDLLALDAVRLIARALPRAYADGNDIAARSDVAWGATLAGLGLSLAGTTAGHALAQPLGARTGLAHGQTIALILPAVLARSWQAEPERYAALADAVGAGSAHAAETARAEALAPWLRSFFRSLNVYERGGLQDVDAALVARLADDVMAYMARALTQHRPVFTREDVVGLYEEARRP